MRTTIIGSKGFIGRNLVAKLKQLDMECFAPERDDYSIFNQELGHVIYCAGITSDYRQRPFDTVRAHVSFLADLLERSKFHSFLYLSSTRIYFYNSEAMEDSKLLVNPNQLDDLFNISKIMGESLCISSKRDNVRIARLSNVYGDDFASNNFLFSIIKDAIHKNEVILHTTLDSEKDYINIQDIVNLLIKISLSGSSMIYNVASGINITNKIIINTIQELTGCKVFIDKNAKKIKFPPININKIKEDFGFIPEDMNDSLKQLISYYQMHVRSENKI